MLAYLLTHLLAYSLTCSLTYLLTYLLTYSLTYSPQPTTRGYMLGLITFTKADSGDSDTAALLRQQVLHLARAAISITVLVLSLLATY